MHPQDPHRRLFPPRVQQAGDAPQLAAAGGPGQAPGQAPRHHHRICRPIQPRHGHGGVACQVWSVSSAPYIHIFCSLFNYMVKIVLTLANLQVLKRTIFLPRVVEGPGRFSVATTVETYARIRRLVFSGTPSTPRRQLTTT